MPIERAKESDGEYNTQFVDFPITLFSPPSLSLGRGGSCINITFHADLGSVLVLRSDMSIREAVRTLSRNNFRYLEVGIYIEAFRCTSAALR